jgi:small subunit ribosomal protein S2
MEPITIQELIENGVHFGCRVSRWNPKMAPYIHGRRNLIHIIELRETIRGLLRARNFLYHLAAEGTQILWVGTKRQVKGVIREAGEQTGTPVVTERWIGGTLTNFSVIRSRLRRLEQLETMEEDGTFNQMSKKYVSALRRERRKITRNLSGIRHMNGIPGAMVIVDPAREYNAVREARKMGIPIIGILDTDCDPNTVDIAIPGNDDALKSVRLLVSRLVTAVEEGAANAREQAASMGDAQRAKEEEAASGDEPRPTTSRPLPRPVAKESAGDGPGAAESLKAASEAKPEPKPEPKPAPVAEEKVAAEKAAGESPTA